MLNNDIFNQINQIAKAGQRDILAEQVKELQAENESLKENLTRILDRIEEAGLQDNFPSAYNRAKQSLNPKK